MRTIAACAGLVMFGCGPRAGSGADAPAPAPAPAAAGEASADDAPESSWVTDGAPTAPAATSHADASGATVAVRDAGRARLTSRWATVGAAEARYRFPIPEGFIPLSAVHDPFGADPVEFDAAGPGGVALPAPTAFKPNGVVVFSDPLGLGFDASLGGVPARVVQLYDDAVHQRFPTASPATIVTIGPWQAIATELSEVIMRDRPIRGGRGYLILDGTATASVDCLWLPADEEVMSAACDAIAGHLERVGR